jgi:hypothetical protein
MMGKVQPELSRFILNTAECTIYNSTTITKSTTGQKINLNQAQTLVMHSYNPTTSPVTPESRSPWLLGRCSSQLRKNCADEKMVYQ